MTERKPPYLAFFGAAVLMFVMIVDGLDVLARVQIRGQSFTEALSESFHYALVQLSGTLLSFVPFAAIAWICASLAKFRRPWAISLMTACFVAFAFLYYRGCMDAQEYLLQHSWTAAALAVGLIPFMSVPIVLLAFLVRFVLVRKVVPTKA